VAPLTYEASYEASKHKSTGHCGAHPRPGHGGWPFVVARPGGNTGGGDGRSGANPGDVLRHVARIPPAITDRRKTAEKTAQRKGWRRAGPVVAGAVSVDVDAGTGSCRRVGDRGGDRGPEKALGAGHGQRRAENFQRQTDSLLAQAQSTDVGRWSHPQWLIDALRQAWPEHWQALLEANNQRPPMTLRVNALQTTAEEYLAELRKVDIDAQCSTTTPSAIQLTQAQDVTLLPGFAEGQVSVQDEAAQQAAYLMMLEAGQRVLDVCAAPGGKTGHMLELADVEMVAVDVEAERLQRVKENLQRLGRSAQCIAGDASQPDAWWDGKPFDRILLDAPCSATGVIRRHPDIKLLRQPSDIDQLVVLQAQILDAIWPLLKPGGMLLYATCSVLPQENAEQVAAFVARQSDAQHKVLDVAWGQSVKFGRQVLTGTAGMDGFYYACLEKKS
jgi:16S rRNA (cytosine967-C5)-methyltransferase